jgi:signal transduction histidine kinase
MKRVPETSRKAEATVRAPSANRGRIADLDWIRALYELGQKAANGAHPQQVSQEILEHIVRGFDAESGSIALIVDGTIDQLELAAGTDLPPGLVGKPLARGTGVFGHVVETGHPVLVNGDAAETGLPLRGGPAERDRSTHSAMCWPLQVAGRTIGAVAVNRAETSPRYTREDLEQGQAVTSLLALVMANHRMHVERDNRILELQTLNATMQRINGMLEDAQNQVIQSEKLASIGQMAAGVAHEINNPLAFALSNLGSLEAYLTKLFELLDAYVEADGALAAPQIAALGAAGKLRAEIDVAFLRRDTADLVTESREGLLRVKRIVQDLRDFSRGGAEEVRQAIDIHDALDRTLNIVRNELKYKANIVRDYGALPEIECVPSRLNQVFLNLLVNAGQAIEDAGTITISTGVDGDEAWIAVADTGCGIAPGNLNRIFDPFFTTKPVGQGTGLGLSVSHSIVRKHGGRLDVESEVGRGTRFTIRLPLQRSNASPANDAERRAA